MKHNNREYLIMILSGTLTMFSGGFIWPIFAAYVRTEFSASLQLVGLAVSGYFLLRMLAEFPMGALSDRMGPRAPLIAGRVLAVFGAFISFQTKAPEVRGVGIGTYRTFFDLGGLIGPVIISAIAGLFGEVRGYLFSFYFCIILVIGLIAMAMMLKEERAESVSKAPA